MDLKELTDYLKDIYSKVLKQQADTVNRIPLSGSNRRYFRIMGGAGPAIATLNEDVDENRAFLYLANHLSKHGVCVPEVFFSAPDLKVYLQEDLGDYSLYHLVNDSKLPEEKKIDAYKKVIGQMPAIQVLSAEDMDFSMCYPRQVFDKQSIIWDLNYFKYLFLKTARIDFHEQKLENDFQKLIGFLLEAPSDFFLYRDFQSRNIMWKDDKPFFIDFQGGRKGALQYDLVSLLYESKTGLSEDFRQEVLEFYIEVFKEFDFFDPEVFLRYYNAFALVRVLQAFGAYGYRGLFEKKSLFVHSINPGIDNLISIAGKSDISDNYPYLCQIISSMKELKPKFEMPAQKDELTVTITSFSYRFGVPDDFSGNGGGYVFDCRVLLNPGRYEEYKLFTGRDKEIISFIEKNAESREFTDNIRNIIDLTVEKYIRRGFVNLFVCFGCTGGRHRSVYTAQKIYEHLKLNFDVNLRLFHRELNIKEEHDKNNVQKKP